VKRTKFEARGPQTGGEHEPHGGTETVIANGSELAARLPCTIEEFLAAHGFLPRSVVVEHNGEAVAPSEFPGRTVHAGDRLEIVRIVAGG
jgi:thiamine biosynthesis protein ThiS